MNGTNKAIIAAVYGTAVAYTAAAFVLTVLSFEGDAGTVLPGIAVLHGPYSDFVAPLSINFAVALAGIALSLAGMATSEPLDVAWRTNPAQYLWTHRPNAFLRCIGAPWGLMTTALKKNLALSVVPIALLPLYAVWSAILSVALIVPFLVAKAVVSAMISSEAKKERTQYRKDTGFMVCPGCKSVFARPLVVCRCGLTLDYPVPGIYGIKKQMCNNGDEIGCTAGSRTELRTSCPHCHEEIETQEANPICIALAGAVGSGKTTLMLAGVEGIVERAKRSTIPTQAATDGVSAEARKSKDYVGRTTPGEKDSQCLFLKPMNRHETELVINDVSGFEFKPSATKSLFEDYYEYVDGVVFVLDPTRLGAAEGQDLLETFNSFYGMYSKVKGARPGTVFGSRMAIVATRKDVTGLEDDDVRGFISNKGKEAFVRTVEAVFEDVRYFSVCATGTGSYEAARPFIWIIESADEELARMLDPSDSANR